MHANFDAPRLKLDYTGRARWPFRAFAQESLKIVTSPTSYRKYPQKHQNSGLPRIITQKGSNLDLSRIAHFSVHFYSHRNQIALSIYGDTSFSPSFLRSIVYFKAISHISGSKKWSKQSVTDAGTQGRRHGQTHIKILRPPAQKPFGQLSS